MNPDEVLSSTISFLTQISRALAGTDRKEIMKKLPKFIYDEDKALEVRRYPFLSYKTIPSTLYFLVMATCSVV